MTLGNIRTAVRERLDDPTFDTIKLDRWINWVIQDIHSRSNFPFKQGTVDLSTVDGTNAYTLTTIASDLDKVANVFNVTQKTTMTYITPVEFDEKYMYNTAEGIPHYWTVDGGELKVYPTPDGVYTLQLEYVKVISDLSDASQSPALPDNWSELIVLGAYAKALEWNDDFDMAGAIWVQFERMLARYIQSANKTSGQNQILDWYRPEI